MKFSYTVVCTGFLEVGDFVDLIINLSVGSVSFSRLSLLLCSYDERKEKGFYTLNNKKTRARELYFHSSG